MLLRLRTASNSPSAKKTSKSRSKSSTYSNSREPGPGVPRSIIEDRDAQRRHNALERQFERAKKQVQPLTAPVSSQSREGEISSQPGSACAQSVTHLEHQRFHERASEPALETLRGSQAVQPGPRLAPEATFTPTTAGLRTGEGQGHVQSLDFQTILTNTLAQALALQLNPQTHMPSNLQGCQHQASMQSQHTPLPVAQHELVSSEDSWQADGDPGDQEFLEDEGVLPDKPAFTALFHPSVFKTLLCKAKFCGKSNGLYGNISEAPLVTPLAC